VAIQAFFLATLVMTAVGLLLLQLCSFLVPYKALLTGPYAGALATYFGALYLNLFAAFYFATRKLLLKDTGRKLAHLEKQLHSDAGLSDELARRLQD
jgi:hypothetical protein